MFFAWRVSLRYSDCTVYLAWNDKWRINDFGKMRVFGQSGIIVSTSAVWNYVYILNLKSWHSLEIAASSLLSNNDFCFVFVSLTFLNTINSADLFRLGVRMIRSWSLTHFATPVATDKHSLASSGILCNYRHTVIFNTVHFRWNEMVTNNSNSFALITE